jgi:hypothetical protein
MNQKALQKTWEQFRPHSEKAKARTDWPESTTIVDRSTMMEAQPTKMAIYEVPYSTKTASDKDLSYSGIVLVKAETHEELTAKVVGLISKLGPPGTYYVEEVTRMNRVLRSESQRRQPRIWAI